MTRYEYTTFFDQRSPTLDPDEQELFYDHPVHPVYSNQIGIIFPHDDNHETFYAANDYLYLRTGVNQKIGIGMRHKLAYECYHNAIVGRELVYHRQGNLKDYTQENLVISHGRSDSNYKIYKNILKQTENNTIRYMLEKSKSLVEKEFDPEYYWNLCKIDPDLIKRWKILFER
jgi:hypothetical protein